MVKFSSHLQDAYNVNRLLQVLKTDEINPATLLNELIPVLEQEWCCFHYLLQSSLHQVSESCMYLGYYYHLKTPTLCEYSLY